MSRLRDVHCCELESCVSGYHVTVTTTIPIGIQLCAHGGCIGSSGEACTVTAVRFPGQAHCLRYGFLTPRDAMWSYCRCLLTHPAPRTELEGAISPNRRFIIQPHEPELIPHIFSTGQG